MDSVDTSNFKDWISAMRLRTLPLSVSGIIVGGCLAAYDGFFKLNVFLFALGTAVGLQILSNLANDYGDGVKGTDNEDRIGPQRAIQSGRIQPYEMYAAIRLNIIIVIFLAFLTIYNAFGLTNFIYSVIFFVLGGFSISAALRYTVGDSAYGYRGLGDVFVFVFFGLVSVIGTYFLFSRQINHVVILPAISIGLLSVSVLNLNNMRDLESDKKVGKNTLAVKLGKKGAKTYQIILIVSAIIVSLLFGLLYYTSPFNCIYFVVYIPLVMHLSIVVKNKDPKLLDSQLKVLALSTFVFAVLLGIGHIL